MAKIAKVDYDEENDILFVYTGQKAHDSLEVGKFVIDFAADNKIVREKSSPRSLKQSFR